MLCSYVSLISQYDIFRNITELGTMFEIIFFMDHRGQFLLYKENWFSCSPSCSQFRNISKHIILRN
ncbi:hypothetical protein C0J52_22430 [Blattella germanica]|nr:hypothetical protein C0J52_22430 [Blattella germanica]